MTLFKSKKKRLKLERAHLLKQKSQAVSLMYQQLALTCADKGVGKNQDEIIVSLTSYGQRLDDVYLTIETIFQQSLKADRIILCLAADEFPNKEKDLPATLRNQLPRGLEVYFCEEDMGPYTKFFYTLKNNPNSLIITIDDDILYPVDLVDKLYSAYQKEPHIIHCHRAHKMALKNDISLTPYKEWRKDISSASAGFDIFPTGVGGVLYFPGCFAEEVLDKDVFLDLAPKSDDVWLKAMSLKNGTLCKKVPSIHSWAARNLIIEGSQLTALKRANKSAAYGNDAKLKAVFDKYNLWPLLATE